MSASNCLEIKKMWICNTIIDNFELDANADLYVFLITEYIFDDVDNFISHFFGNNFDRFIQDVRLSK
jgi:hypothetical protein